MYRICSPRFCRLLQNSLQNARICSDRCASVENLLLEADLLGLGAVWLGIAPLKERMEAVHNALQISQDLVAFAIVPCGYPDALHSQQDRFDFKRVHYIS